MIASAKVKKLAENIRPHSESMVELKTTGNISQVKYMTNTPIMTIRKLDKDNYMELKTGKIKQFKHTENRIESKTNLKQTFSRLRDIINTNVTEPDNCKFITLTYKENMTNPNQLYNDFRKFNMRLQYYLKANDMPKYEYIVAIEPQHRGAWHAHFLAIFESKAPFIPNDTIAEIWGYGFTKTKALKNVDNIGAYLSAYLSDMEISDMDFNQIKSNLKNGIKEIKSDGETKAIIKGARFQMYPTGIRVYRTSRGIKQPTIEKLTNQEAMEKVSNSVLTYEKTIQVIGEDENVINTINYRHFNGLRKVKVGAENEKNC